MEEFLFFLLTLLAAAIGGIIAYKLKLPAGAMVGSMAAAVAFNLLTERAVFYPDLKVVLQIVSGALIGSRMGREDVASMKQVIFPIVMLLVSMLVLNVTFGGLMYKFSPLNLATSLFAAAPGGASDMAIIASDLGANTAYVAILQLFRLIVIFSCMPPLFKKIITKLMQKEAKQAEAKGEPRVQRPQPIFSIKKFALLLLASALGGMAFYFLGVTAGAMIGGMLASMAFCVWKGKVKFPVKIRVALQICSGAYIGMQLDRASLLAMGDLLIPMLIMFVGIFVFAFGSAFVIHKVTKLSLITCLMASTPGGVQEMSLLADEMGCDTPKVAIMQTSRLVCVIAFFPTMLELMVKFFS